MASPKKKILIVDDDKFLLDMYAIKFNQGEFDVMALLSASEALAKLREGMAPDAIITDLIMPGMDGFEFLETIKKENLAGEAKKIILSNKGERSDIDRGLSLGVHGYIIKASAIPSEVVAKVKEILSKR